MTFKNDWVWVLPGLAASAIGLFAAAQQSNAGGPYTVSQAGAGRAAYEANCAPCHGASLSGTPDAPPLAGRAFMDAWRARTTLDLIESIQTMPPAAPGVLGQDAYLNIAAYILQSNGVAAGPRILTRAAAGPLATVFGIKAANVPALPPSPAAVAAAAQSAGPPPERPPDPPLNREVANFTPVTDAMLLNPDPNEWINWRRTLDGWGYSPLNQITTQNAHQLQLAWSWGLGVGNSQPTPLVHSGIMYVSSPIGAVQALDAETGEFIWEYRKTFEVVPRALNSMRNIAIYGDKIFVATQDVHLVSLNARTGAVVWDQTVADYKLGYRYNSGPIIVKGKVVTGMNGCDRYKQDACFITAHDAETGALVWKTSTVARPGEPGGESWGDRPLLFRGGGDAWIPGSYDPATNLIYWSTAQAKPWARVQRKAANSDAELYTNSVLALNPETGKMKWYHQFIPGDSHDIDEVFESLLIDHDGRRSLFKMGKAGILWELDRETGQFITAHDLGYQNLFELNRRTGQLIYRPGMVQALDVEVDFCPAIHGFKSWQAIAYHPGTRAFYVPMLMACQLGTFPEVEQTEGRGGNGRILGAKFYLHPAATPGKNGQFLAMDMTTGKVLWRHETRMPMASAALTTAGGLAIVGDADRYLYVHDAVSGKVVFQTRLPSAVQGFPMTYAIKGQQYLAIPVGTGDGGWQRTGAGIAKTQPAPPVNGIFVFKLPDR